MLTNLMSSIPVGISVSTPDGRVIEANKAIIEMFGFNSLEEFVNYPAIEYYYNPEDRNRFIKLLEKGRVIDFELRVKRHDGTYFWGSVTSVTQASEKYGTLFISSFIDITERKKSEEALIKEGSFVSLLQKIAVTSNESSTIEKAMQVCLDKVCTLMDWPVGHVYMPSDDGTGLLIPSGLWHLDDPEKFKSFREATDRSTFKPGFGLPGRILASKQPAWIIDVNNDPKFTRGKLVKNLGVKAAFGFPVLLETEVVAVLEFFAKTEAEPDEKLLEVMANIGQQLGRVEERSRAEKALLKNQFYLIKSQEIGSIGTWEIDIKNNAITWTDESYKIFGVPLGTKIDYELFQNCIHPDDRDYINKKWSDSLNKGHYDIEHRIVANDKIKWVKEKADFEFDTEGNPVKAIGVVQDITELKKAEDKLKAAKIEAESANIAKSNFLSSMSHELRTPLNAILGFSQILEGQFNGKLNDEQMTYVKDIFSSGKHLLSLINDILDLSKIEEGKSELHAEKLNIEKILTNSLIMIKRRCIEHNINLNLNIDESIKSFELIADGRKIKQIMYNLLSNAAKFTQDNGNILVEASKSSEFLKVSISDSGIGIKKDDQEKIFQKFFQTKGGLVNKTKGTGLGLSIVKNLVELHGGKLEVRSEGNGKGTTFSFTIPVRYEQ